MAALKYVGEWLTLDQAARVLGIRRGELRPLWKAGRIECVEIRPGIWRARTSTVDALARSAEWKARGRA